MDDLPLPAHVIERIERQWAAKLAKPASLNREKGQANNVRLVAFGPMNDGGLLTWSAADQCMR